MKKLVIALLILPLSYTVSIAQDAPSQPAPEFPDYIVRPSEDLNPYGLSSLGTTTEEGAIDDAAGSLGSKTSNRPSNLDVNKSIQDKKNQELEEAKAQEVQNQQVETIEEEAIQYDDVSSSRSKSKSGMIKWVDDNGVQHITNNVGSVPPQYRDQIK